MYLNLLIYTGTPYFIVLHITYIADAVFFYKLKVCGNQALSKSTGAIFLRAFAHFVSVKFL